MKRRHTIRRVACRVAVVALVLLVHWGGRVRSEDTALPTLNEDIDAFVSSLASREEPSLRRLRVALGTLAGRVALLEALVRLEEDDRAMTSEVAFEKLAAVVRGAEFRRRCKAREKAVAGLRKFSQTVADQLHGDSVLEEDLRAFLRREDAPDVVFDVWIREPRGTEPSKIVWNNTQLGRALVQVKKGRIELNRHVLWETDDLLVRLARRAARRARLLDAVGASARPFARAELARLACEKEPVEEDHLALSLWIERALDGSDAAPIEALFARAPAIEKELQAEGSHLRLDLDALDYCANHVDLLRSSIFYNPRTRSGVDSYDKYFKRDAAEGKDHFAARLFGTWGWNAKVSKDAKDLVKRLRGQKRMLQRLAETHEKLILYIAGTPPWLSISDDPGTFEGGGWSNKRTHPPKDMALWRRLIRELALVFRDVEGVDRYYEFWNEPDLEYWQGSLDDFLALYAETARVIRETDPQGKIGGCAVNQWDGRIRKKKGSDILNYELIRYAKANDLPLDFVSWHHFGRPVTAIAEAKAAYEAELRRAGYASIPEFLVTEWSFAGRGTPHANVFFSETMLGFYEAGITAQTVACLEEFHAKPNPKHFAPWGLVTQQGYRKNAWHAHRLFDALARDSHGVAILRPNDRRTIVVSREGEGVYDLLLWERGTPPRLKAAWDSLRAAGYDRKAAARTYRVFDRLERAIASGEPPSDEWADAWKTAKRIYDEHPIQTSRIVLQLPGAKRIVVREAEIVRMRERTLDVVVVGDQIGFPFGPQELARLRFEVR